MDEFDYKESKHVALMIYYVMHLLSLSAGEFPAHAAVREGNLQLLSMLIKEGHCGINDKDQNGSTPAHKGNASRFI